MTIDQIAARIVDELRKGPATSAQLRERLQIPEIYVNPQILGNALQLAKADGLIEYSKADGDRRAFWRMVKRTPARKVGASVAKAICYGQPHQQVKSEIDEAYAQGFADGQQHAFQTVAARLRAFIERGAKIGCVPDLDDLNEMADEIESGAWAEKETDAP